MLNNKDTDKRRSLLMASIRASRASGDMITAYLLSKELKALRRGVETQHQFQARSIVSND